jgi:hypothetical protein
MAALTGRLRKLRQRGSYLAHNPPEVKMRSSNGGELNADVRFGQARGFSQIRFTCQITRPGNKWES